MPAKTLFVKNMVCLRCLLAVENILDEVSIDFQEVIAGEIHLAADISEEQNNLLHTRLSAIGLELIDNKMSNIIEKVKQLVIKKARLEVSEAENRLNLSVYLSQNLYHEYTYLSSLFSSI